MRACPALVGNPRRQPMAHQATAAVRPAPTMATPSAPSTVTIPAMVPATAVPITSGPRKLKTAASTTAGPGRATRVTMGMATAAAASFTPFSSA